jgi:glycosidase
MKRLMVTEVYDSVDVTVKYCDYNGVRGANIPFNFQFIQLNRVEPNVSYNEAQARQRGKGTPFEPRSIKSLIDPWISKLPEMCWNSWVLGNHDNIRVGTRIGVEFIDLSNTLKLLLGGTPFSYYGEELGMVNLGEDKISFQDCQDLAAINLVGLKFLLLKKINSQNAINAIYYPNAINQGGPQNYMTFSRDYERTPMQWNNESQNAGFTDSSVKPWLPVNENYVDLNVQVDILI